VSRGDRQLHTTSRATQSLRSIHNLHTIYEEFTGLECVPVRLEAGEYTGTTHTIFGAGHEEHSSPSVLVHDLSLARHTDRSGDSDMTGYAHTNHLSSSSDADRAALRHDDHIRPKHGAIVSLGRDAWSTLSSQE